jgi:hypothetical protein
LGFGILGVRILDFGKMDISGYGDSGFGILDFGKMDFGILDFGKMDISGKRPVREKVYSGKCLVREIGIRENDFGKRYIREN